MRVLVAAILMFVLNINAFSQNSFEVVEPKISVQNVDLEKIVENHVDAIDKIINREATGIHLDKNQKIRISDILKKQMMEIYAEDRTKTDFSLNYGVVKDKYYPQVHAVLNRHQRAALARSYYYKK